jgi:hypothetical protein
MIDFGVFEGAPEQEPSKGGQGSLSLFEATLHLIAHQRVQLPVRDPAVRVMKMMAFEALQWDYCPRCLIPIGEASWCGECS